MKSLSPTLDMSSRPIANLSAISNLTSNGFVTTSGANGTLGIDTTVYINQVNTDLTLTGLGTGPASPGGSSPLGVAIFTDLAWTAAQSITLTDAGTTNVLEGLSLHHNSSGTPAANFGVSLGLYGKSATVLDRQMANIQSIWTVATDASRASALDFQVASGGVLSSRMRLFPTGGLCVNRSVDPGAGIVDANSGYMKAGIEWPINANGIVKRTGAYTYAAAVSGTDYLGSVVSDSTMTGVGTSASPLGVVTTADLGWTASQSVSISDATTNGVPMGLVIRHRTSATPVADFGIGLQMYGDSATVADRVIGDIFTRWTDPTDATRTGKFEFLLMRNGTGPTTGVRMYGDGSLTVNRNVASPGAGIGNIDISGVYETNGSQIATNDLAASSTNDTPAAGKIGQVIRAAITVASGATFSNNVAKNVTSISLTAGDWDVRGAVVFSGATVPAGGAEQLVATISNTSATIADDGTQGYGVIVNPTGATQSLNVSVALPPSRFSLASTTTIYLVGQVAFASGTVKGAGFIEARRIR